MRKFKSVYVSVCSYVCLCVSACEHLYVGVCVSVSISLCLTVCLCMSVCERLCGCVYIWCLCDWLCRSKGFLRCWSSPSALFETKCPVVYLCTARPAVLWASRDLVSGSHLSAGALGTLLWVYVGPGDQPQVLHCKCVTPWAISPTTPWLLFEVFTNNLESSILGHAMLTVALSNPWSHLPPSAGWGGLQSSFPLPLL